MKKVLMLVAVAATLSLTACCGGENKECKTECTKTEEAAPVAEEVVAPVAEEEVVVEEVVEEAPADETISEL